MRMDQWALILSFATVELFSPSAPIAAQSAKDDKVVKDGAVVVARGPEGQTVPMRVHQINEKSVVIDMNHPMAGKTLVFDVKILDIQAAATPQPPKPEQPAAPPQPAKPNPPK